MNVQRVALRLGVAEHTVRRWSASGLLPCTRTPGGHRRFRAEDVDALAQQLGGSSQAAARQARERELDTLLETSLALVSRLETTELLREIAARLTRLMDCTFCGISALDEPTQTVTMLADYDSTGRRLPDTAPYRLERFPLTRRVLELREAAVVNVGDPAADRDEVRELEREGDKSLLLVPLVYAGRSIGLLELIDKMRERRYTRQELRICRAVASQAAVALRNAESFARAGDATRELDAVRRLVGRAAARLEALGCAAGKDGVLQEAAEAALEVASAVSCVVAAGGRSAGALAPAAHGAGSAPAVAPGPQTLDDAAVVTATAGSGTTAVTLTAALPRPAGRAEVETLSLLAAAAAGHLGRLEDAGA